MSFFYKVYMVQNVPVFTHRTYYLRCSVYTLRHVELINTLRTYKTQMVDQGTRIIKAFYITGQVLMAIMISIETQQQPNMHNVTMYCRFLLLRYIHIHLTKNTLKIQMLDNTFCLQFFISINCGQEKDLIVRISQSRVM